MAGVRFALPAFVAYGDQVVPQVRIGQRICNGFGVLLGSANGDQVDIGIAIKITLARDPNSSTSSMPMPCFTQAWPTSSVLRRKSASQLSCCA